MAPFDLTWIKRLHKEMFGDVWKWAGEIRTRDLNVGVRWSLIDEKLQNLLSDLEFWDQSAMDVVERAVRLHHQAVQIHPFYNGNGRWSRMLANILLRMRGHPQTSWPENLLGTESTIRGALPGGDQGGRPGELRPALDAHARAYAERMSLAPAASPGSRLVDRGDDPSRWTGMGAGAKTAHPWAWLFLPHFAFIVQ